MGTNRRDSPVDGRGAPLGSRQRVNTPTNRASDNVETSLAPEQPSSFPESAPTTASPSRFLTRENTGPTRLPLSRELTTNVKSASITTTDSKVTPPTTAPTTTNVR